MITNIEIVCPRCGSNKTRIIYDENSRLIQSADCMMCSMGMFTPQLRDFRVTVE